ncbi:MAG: glycosyltransferase [Prevotella sp.]|jgi:hypothetical protein|nr:glycosyltransferase [Prevotella sp.]
MGVKDIVFFYGDSASSLGGIQTVFASLSEELQNRNYNIWIVDKFPEFFCKISKISRNQCIKFDYTRQIVVPDNAVVICSLGHANLQGNVVGKNIRLLYWSLFDYFSFYLGLSKVLLKFGFLNFTKNYDKLHFWINIFNGKLQDRMKRFLQLADIRKGLLFMTEEHILLNEQWYKMRLENRKVLPLCVRIDGNVKTLRPLSNEINICWLGRFVEFKFFSIKYLLKKIEEYAISNPSKRIKFILIGNGAWRGRVERECRKYKSFDIQLTGWQYPEKVKEIFINEVDVLFAHGTAALDGAKVGLPTVIVSGSYDEIPSEKKICWLYEAEGKGNVGSLNEKRNSVHSFSDIMSMLICDNITIGKKCYDHVERNFDVSKVASDLLIYANETRLTMEDYRSIGMHNHLWMEKWASFFREHLKLKI